MLHFEPLDDRGGHLDRGDQREQRRSQAVVHSPSDTEREPDVVDGMGGLASAASGYLNLEGDEGESVDAIGAQLWPWESRDQDGSEGGGYSRMPETETRSTLATPTTTSTSRALGPWDSEFQSAVRSRADVAVLSAGIQTTLPPTPRATPNSSSVDPWEIEYHHHYPAAAIPSSQAARPLYSRSTVPIRRGPVPSQYPIMQNPDPNQNANPYQQGYQQTPGQGVYYAGAPQPQTTQHGAFVPIYTASTMPQSYGPGAPYANSSASSGGGPLSPGPTSPGGMSNSDDPQHEKRLRNTAASARFRAKKKQREASLERQSREKREAVQKLEGRVVELEEENRFLKGLVIEKGEVRRQRLAEGDVKGKGKEKE